MSTSGPSQIPCSDPGYKIQETHTFLFAVIMGALMLMLLIMVIVKNYRLLIVPNSTFSALQTYFSPHTTLRGRTNIIPVLQVRSMRFRGENSRLGS